MRTFYILWGCLLKKASSLIKLSLMFVCCSVLFSVPLSVNFLSIYTCLLDMIIIPVTNECCMIKLVTITGICFHLKVWRLNSDLYIRIFFNEGNMRRKKHFNADLRTNLSFSHKVFFKQHRENCFPEPSQLKFCGAVFDLIELFPFTL